MLPKQQLFQTSIPLLIRMVIPRRTGGGNVGKVVQNLPPQYINIHGIGRLFNKGGEVLLVVVQRSLPDFLRPLKGQELSGSTLQCTIFNDSPHAHTTSFIRCTYWGARCRMWLSKRTGLIRGQPQHKTGHSKHCSSCLIKKKMPMLSNRKHGLNGQITDNFVF